MLEHRAAVAVDLVEADLIAPQIGEMLSFELIPDGETAYTNRWTKEGGWAIHCGGNPYLREDKRPAEPGVVGEGVRAGCAIPRRVARDLWLRCALARYAGRVPLPARGCVQTPAAR